MAAEQQYIDLYSSKCEALVNCHVSGSALTHPEKGFSDFIAKRFPQRNSEDYKYTDVDKAFAPDFGLNINRLDIPVNPYDVFRCDVPNLSTRLYFMVNDRFTTVKPDVKLPEGVYAGGLFNFNERDPEIAARYYAKAAPSEKDGIIALNTSSAQDGFVLYVPKGVVVEKPVQLVSTYLDPMWIQWQTAVWYIPGRRFRPNCWCANIRWIPKTFCHRSRWNIRRRTQPFLTTTIWKKVIQPQPVSRRCMLNWRLRPIKVAGKRYIA